MASDSCCSILSTTFLKGGLLKGSASQQDLIIWYLHSSIHTDKHFYFSAVIPSSFLFVPVIFFPFSLLKNFNMSSVLVTLVKSQMPHDENGLLFRSPHIAFFHSLTSSICPTTPSLVCSRSHFTFNTFYTRSFFSWTTTHISLGANSGASIL